MKMRLTKQSAFRKEQTKYDTVALHDSLAKPSRKVDKSHMKIEGDGEVWLEKLYRHAKTGETKRFFVSQSTGKKVPDEPPSGASHVIYLRESFLEELSSNPSSPLSSSEKYNGGNSISGEEQQQLMQVGGIHTGCETPKMSAKSNDMEMTSPMNVTPSPPRLTVSFLQGKFDGDFDFSDCDGYYNERPKLLREKGSKHLSQDLAEVTEG